MDGTQAAVTKTQARIVVVHKPQVTRILSLRNFRFFTHHATLLTEAKHQLYEHVADIEAPRVDILTGVH